MVCLHPIRVILGHRSGRACPRSTQPVLTPRHRPLRFLGFPKKGHQCDHPRCVEYLRANWRAASLARSERHRASVFALTFVAELLRSSFGAAVASMRPRPTLSRALMMSMS